MKKLFLTLVSAALFQMTSFAQPGEKSLNLYYFVHERSTPVRELCREIEEYFNIAVSDPNTDTFLYMANAETPIVVYCSENNRSDLNNMLAELRTRRSHPVFPEDDIRRIVELFNQNDYRDAYGNEKYSMVNAIFYIGDNFWINAYPETLISRLAFIMDWEKEKSDFLHLEVYTYEADGFDYESERKDMFGKKQLFPPLGYLLNFN